MRVKLLAACSSVILVGLLGAGPVWAQDEPLPADDEAGTGAEGDGEATADELIAKALAFITGIQEEGASRPPIRMESQHRFGNQYEGDLPPELDFPDFYLRGIGTVDSLGNSQYYLTLVPDSTTERDITSQEQLAYDTIDNIPHSKFIGNTLYMGTEVIALLGWPLEDATTWLALDTSQVAEQSMRERFLGLMASTTMDLQEVFLGAFLNVSGDDEYMKSILETAKSSQVIGKENIRGHETTQVSLQLQALDAVAVHTTQVFETSAVFDFMGYQLSQPDPSIAQLIFSPDSLVNVEVWIDGEGRVHRTFTDVSEIFSKYFVSLQVPGVDLDAVREAFNHSSVIDLIYLDENPGIEPPPPTDVTHVDNIGSYLNEIRDQFLAELRQQEAEEALPDTGVNTPLLAIVGLTVLVAGAMIIGFSRRLRSQSLM